MAVCGDRVIQDAVLGNASIIHIIDRIAAEGFPVLVPRLACLFLLARDDRDEASYADGEVNKCRQVKMCGIDSCTLTMNDGRSNEDDRSMISSRCLRISPNQPTFWIA